jgi:hypothetical protein
MRKQKFYSANAADTTANTLESVYEKLPFYQSKYFWLITAAIAFGAGWYFGKKSKK